MEEVDAPYPIPFLFYRTGLLREGKTRKRKEYGRQDKKRACPMAGMFRLLLIINYRFGNIRLAIN